MIALLALLVPSAAAQDASGYVELRGAWHAEVDGKAWQLFQTARPTFDVALHEDLHLVATPELSLSQGRDLQSELQRTIEDSDLGPLLEAAGCFWPEEPEDCALGVQEARDYLSVERLYLDVYQQAFDLRLGRQAIHWGSAMVVNPTDPFPEVRVAEPWRPRLGVNALRGTVPLGPAMSELHAVVGVDDSLRHERAAVRYTLDLPGVDIAGAAAWRGEVERGIAGVDVRGTLGVGYWLEGVVHLGDQVQEEIAVGLDYSFPLMEQLVLGAQYYRNGRGAPDLQGADMAGRMGDALQPPICPDGLAELQAEGERDPFAPFFLGTDYAMGQAMLGLHADVSLSGAYIQNLRDGTGVVVPVLQYRPTGALELAFSGQLPVRVWDDGGEFVPRREDLRLVVEPIPGVERSADLSGLVPRAVLAGWTRLYF